MMVLSDLVSRRLKIGDLYTFDAVVRLGSMSKAAAHLNIAQSAISKTIRDLEHTIGVTLLDRTPLGVEPTIYGKILISHANAIFDEVRQGINDIQAMTAPGTGEVRIGCDEPFAGLIAAGIQRLRRRHPGIVYHLIQSPFTATLEFRELHERRVDLMLARVTDPFEGKGLRADVLFHEQIFVVAGKRSKWGRRRDVRLSDLASEPWILTPPSSLPTMLAAEAFRAIGAPIPEARVVSQSVHLRNNLLLSGQYLTVLPGSFIRFNPIRASLKVLPIELPSAPQPIAIVTPEYRTPNAATRQFIECVREGCRPLVRK